MPEDHPFWTHPKVTVTPHIASATRPATAAQVIAENIRRGEAGEPLLHLVDRREALASRITAAGGHGHETDPPGARPARLRPLRRPRGAGTRARRALRGPARRQRERLRPLAPRHRGDGGGGARTPGCTATRRYDDLRHALAAHHGIAAANVVAGEGIDGLLGYLVRLLVGPGDAVVTSAGAYPTFNYHVAGYGGTLHTVPYRGDHEDPEALLAKAAEVDAKLDLPVEPRQPDGQLARRGRRSAP